MKRGCKKTRCIKLGLGLLVEIKSFIRQKIFRVHFTWSRFNLIQGSVQSTWSVTGVAASDEAVTRRRKRSLGGRAWWKSDRLVHALKREKDLEKTYTIDCRHSQGLGTLITRIKVRFTDCA